MKLRRREEEEDDGKEERESLRRTTAGSGAGRQKGARDERRAKIERVRGGKEASDQRQ